VLIQSSKQRRSADTAPIQHTTPGKPNQMAAAAAPSPQPRQPPAPSTPAHSRVRASRQLLRTECSCLLCLLRTMPYCPRHPPGPTLPPPAAQPFHHRLAHSPRRSPRLSAVVSAALGWLPH
jgi:hypothetical protein